MGKGKNWWEDKEFVANLPQDMQDAIQQAVDKGQTYDDSDVTPGDTGTPSSN